MSRLHAFFVPLGAVTLVLATGGLNLQTQSSSAPASIAFVAQAVPLDDRLLDDRLNGMESQPERILELAIETLDPRKTPWQSMKILQRARTDDIAFEAHSSLVRGPNHCARLETTLKTGGMPAHVLIVSDGTLLGHALRRPGQEPQTNGMTLPPFIETNNAVLEERERLLVEKGCGGPHAMLADLKARIKEPRLTTGLLIGIAVLRISGSLDGDPASIPQGARLARPAHACHLYLDAQTLLPVRIEWWGSSGLVLEIAYSDVTLNQPLSHEQCVKEFTFTPQ